jgi:hypothetical protein
MSDLQRLLSHELDEGERIIWAGKPNAWALGWELGGRTLLVSMGLMLMLLVPIALGFNAGVIYAHNVVGTWIMIILFFALILIILIRNLSKFMGGGRICYVLTNRRVIVRERGEGITSFKPTELSDLDCQVRGNRGSLLITKGYWGGRGRGPRWVPAVGLIAIENPQNVHQLIQQHLLKPGS